MAFARPVILCVLVALACAPALPGSAADEETARSWHGGAAAAAEAAAARAAAVEARAAAVEAQTAAAEAQAQGPPAKPPAPKPAERPAALTKQSTEPAQPPAADKATPAAKGDAKAGKAGEEATDETKKDKAKKKPALTAKQLFGTVKTGAPLQARAIGWYAKGCLAGGKPLDVNGPGWQVMRLSRNRNWAHPDLVALIERLARETTAAKEWSGLLVGDMSQPRGGPMTSGHKSHQVGLDADIWFTPMPDRILTRREREDISAVSMLKNAGEVDTKVWGPGQVKLIKRAASYPAIERVLVHPAIKKALCEAAGTDRAWLAKVRPFYSHYYHFHLRIGCPKGSTNCQHQPPVPGDDGCGAELKDWLKKVAPKPKAKPKPHETAKPSKPTKPIAEMTLADLPPDCRTVLTAGGHVPPTEPADVVDNSKNAAPVNDLTVVTAAPEPPKKKEEAAPPPTKKAASQ